MFIHDLATLEAFIRSVHLSVLIISVYLVLCADLTAAKSVFRSLGEADFNRLHRHHSLLSKSLVIFWATGVFLIWRGTGFELAQFSPKLMAKIAVVALLTVNAMVIGRAAMPYLEANKGLTFGQFSFGMRMRFASCAALSTASWVSAFCLGSIAWLKTASVEELVTFLGPIYLACFAGACGVAMLTGIIKPRADGFETAAHDDGALPDLPQAAMIPGE